MSKFLDDFLVGIDVSRGFSVAAMLAPNGELIRKPFKVEHTPDGFHKFLEILKKEEERLQRKPIYFVESTGIFHLPLFFFLRSNNLKGFVLNPLCVHSIKNFDLRKVKNDNKDAEAIARLAKYQDFKFSLVPKLQILALRMMARDYYQAKCVNKKNKVALAAVMHKVLQYIFAVLRDDKPYEVRKPECHQSWRKNKLQSVAA